MSIGGTLAEARQRAGLSVADVSARTRIRQGLIRDIERDEFAGCGGDFYARGHIRAIAAAVGADPGPLVGLYDALHAAGGRPAPGDMAGPAAGAPRGRNRGGRLLPAVMAAVIAGSVVLAYQLTGGTGGSPGAAAGPSPARAAARAPAPGHGARPGQGAAPGGAAPGPGSRRHAPAGAAASTLRPVSATAVGPGGASDGDNPQGAPLALSGDPATPWHTDWYTTARFGNLQRGTGLLLDLGRTVTATGVAIRLGDRPGADFQVRAGTSRAHLRTVAGADGAGGAVRLSLPSHPRARYLLIWFTRLPPDAAGTYQADVSSVTVTAASG